MVDPAHSPELMSGTEATAPQELYLYRFGSAEFDEARFELRVGGLPVNVERRPLEVLVELLRHAGEIVTHDELRNTVWARKVTIDKVVAITINRLRKALGTENAALIQNQPRVGYRLTGPVRRVAVGRRVASALQLEVGSRLPEREDVELLRQLSSAEGREVWLGRSNTDGGQRVFKFASDGVQLAAIKREATLSRVLQETLPDRTDFLRVVGWNFEHPPYYIETEFGGQNLLEWSRTASAFEDMGATGRLSLAMRIVDVVAAAHSAGVLHKDLKPANVLIDDNGQGGWRLRLADFGSGQLLEAGKLDELGITRLGDSLFEDVSSDGIGTALYLAPELIAGFAPTVQSDVYALGILLYQMVAGDLTRPLASGWEQDVEDPLVREDILAATQLKPEDRPDSAGALAMRLRQRDARRREQQHLAQLAAAEERARAIAERARARRPWIVGLVAVLVLGLVSSIGFALKARQAQHETARQLARADAINRFLNQDVLSAVRSRAVDAGTSATIRDVLDVARERVADRFAADAYTQAGVYFTLARAYHVMEAFDVADTLYTQTLAALDSATGDDPALRVEIVYRQALAALQKDPEGLGQQRLASADAQYAEALSGETQAALWSALGHAYQLRNRLDLANATIQLNRAIELQKVLPPLQPDVEFQVRYELADAIYFSGDYAGAVEQFRSLVVDPRFSVDQLGLDVVNATYRLGSALRASGQWAEAETVLLQSITDLERMAGPSYSKTLDAISMLGAVEWELGKFDSSAERYQLCYDRTLARYGEAHRRTAVALSNLAETRALMGDTEQALIDARHAVDIGVAALGPDHRTTRALQFMLVRAYISAQRYAEALTLTDSLDPAELAIAMPSSGWPERYSVVRGEILLGLGRYDEGAPLLDTAVAGMLARGLTPDQIPEALELQTRYETPGAPKP